MDYKKASRPFEGVKDDDLGWLETEFESFRPNPLYNHDKRMGVGAYSWWPTVKPEHGPPIPDFDKTIEKMMKSTWKFAEPKQGAARESNAVIGLRGMPQPIGPREAYQPAVRPKEADLPTKLGNNAAIASDWNIFNEIERVNAVTFRGDTRSPYEIIVKAKGFNPPNTRTDRYYLENSVYGGFQDYMKRRLGRDIDKQDFLDAVNKVAPTRESQQLLCDYTVWRGIMTREAAHLGRMVEQELLKGYISTARAMDSSILFGTGKHKVPGWLYLVVVHGGFIVPMDLKKFWSTAEAEIAQLGWIPSERIVGFTRLDYVEGKSWQPIGPIFIRTTFRKTESKACEIMFNFMSGKNPDRPAA